MKMIHDPHSPPKGFTLVEALVTIAIIGVMASLLVAAFSNAAADGNKAVARQQQAAVQGALSAWVGSDANRVTTNTSTGVTKVKTIEEIRTAYNALNSASKQRLAAITPYLDDTSAAMFTSYAGTTSDSRIKSPALASIKYHLELPNWTSGSYPVCNLVAD